MTFKKANLFKLKRRDSFRENRNFIEILKRLISITFVILLIFLFLFIGHILYVRVVEDPFFSVKEIEIKGCKKISSETLRSMAKIDEMPNILTLKLNEIAKRLEIHPWIEDLRIKKLFPNKILIEVKERNPLAIIQLERLYYIDTKGIIFSPVGEMDTYNYPILTGITRERVENRGSPEKDLIKKAIDFLRFVEQNKIPPLEKISEIHLEDYFGIHCFSTEEGVEVRIGWGHYEEKLRRLSIVWSDIKKKGLSPNYIDCSDLKRVVVRGIPNL